MRRLRGLAPARARTIVSVALAGGRAASAGALLALGAGCMFFNSNKVSAPAPTASVPSAPLPAYGPVELPPVTPAAAPAPAPRPAASANDARRGAPYSAKYSARVAQAVRSNVIYRVTARVTQPCEVDVSIAPDGRIIGFSVTRSSGSHDWDEAVKRALLRTHTLPLDTDGRIPEQMVLSLKPK